MSETTVTIIVAVIAALGSVITAIVARLARRGVDLLDAKTKFLDEAGQLRRKEDLKNRIVEVAEIAVRSTMQTYVDEVKARNADGKLTKEEASEALGKARETALGILKEEGIKVGKDILSATIEAVVGSVREPGKNLSGGEATPKAA